MSTRAPFSLVGWDVIEEMTELAKQTPVDGCFVEVGVYRGGTAWYLANLAESQGRQFFGYDTFSGIPSREEFDSHQVGDFNDTSFEEVQQAVPYATFIRGTFPDSAVEMSPVAFVHLDCDQYRSYIDSINFLLPRMLPGGVMWFDDFCLPGAAKAITELCGDRLISSTTGKHYIRS